MEESKKIIEEIKNEKSIKSFLDENGLDDKVVETNILTFYSYKVKLAKCKGCKGLEHCQSVGTDPVCSHAV